MAKRKTIFVTNEIYHVFNRSVQGLPIFRGKRECQFFTDALKFYLQSNPPTKFSLYRINKDRFTLPNSLPLTTVVNFCLMPNHFHLTLRQEKEKGIQRLMQRLSNSFAHYFSSKYKNRGPLFEGNFKAVRVENDEQLAHLSRYIHLNPVTSYLVEKPEQYPFSSYRVYLGEERSEFIDPSPVLNQFSSTKKYQEFVVSQKEYQRILEKIKHLLLE